MPDFSPGDFHIDHLVTNILVAFRPLDDIGTDIFPVIPVTKQSNRFAKIDKGNWFRRPTTLRAPGTGAREVSYTVSSDSYNAENYELATVVPWETIDNADVPFQPAVRAGEFLISQLMLDANMRIRALIAGGVGSTTTLTGGNAWDQFATSDPLTDIEVAQEGIRETTGFNPNICVIGHKAWLKLRRHPDIIRHINPSGLGGPMATAQQFGNLIGVDRVLIGRSINNTSNEGQSDSFVDVWSSDCTLMFVTPTPGIMVPTFGYAFRWSGPNIGAGGPGNFQMQRMTLPERKSDKMRTGYYQDEKIVAAELGFNIRTGITS